MRGPRRIWLGGIVTAAAVPWLATLLACRGGGGGAGLIVSATGVGFDEGDTVYLSPLQVALQVTDGGNMYPLEGRARWLIDGREYALLHLDGLAFDTPALDTSALTDGAHEASVEITLPDGRSGSDTISFELASAPIVREVRFLVDTTGRWEAIEGDNPELEVHYYGPSGFLGCHELPMMGPALLGDRYMPVTLAELRDGGVTIVVTDDDDLRPCPSEQSSAAGGGLRDPDDEIARFGPFDDASFRAGTIDGNAEVEVVIGVGRGR